MGKFISAWGSPDLRQAFARCKTGGAPWLMRVNAAKTEIFFWQTMRQVAGGQFVAPSARCLLRAFRHAVGLASCRLRTSKRLSDFGRANRATRFQV
jgi:hypothetical protein